MISSTTMNNWPIILHAHGYDEFLATSVTIQTEYDKDSLSIL